MTKLHDRLRAAFEARADEIPTVPPPLELQPSRRRSGSARRRRLGTGGVRQSMRWWLPPVIAALAVTAVILAALAASGNLPGASHPPALPAVSAPIQESVPPYYAAIVTDHPLTQFPLPRSVATVRDTATGRLLATVRPPSPYTGFSEVSGANDDRTFVLLANARGQGPLGVTQQRLYLLRINPAAASAARRASLTALPASFIAGGDSVVTMALSPDGRALAALLTPSLPSSAVPPDASLAVDYLATGTTRTWVRYACRQHECQSESFGPTLENLPAFVTLTWAQNGKSLAFVTGPGVSQLRLLDLHAPGDNAQANSRPFSIRGMPVGYWDVSAMAPDTKSAFISYRGSGSSPSVPIFGGLVRYSARSGKLTTINALTFSTGAGYAAFGGPMSDDVVWISYDGSQVIVLDARPGQTAGIYAGTRYTPLPWPANVLDAAW